MAEAKIRQPGEQVARRVARAVAVAVAVAVYFPVEQAVVGVVEFPVAVAVVVRQSCVLPQELSRRWRADGRTTVLCTDP